MILLILGVVLIVSGVNSQGAVSYTFNHDGSSSIGAKMPIVAKNNNIFSAIGSKSSSGVLSKGIAMDNVNGNSLSLSHTSIRNFGSQLTGAGRLNLLNTNNNRLDANAFITRNMPNIPKVPGFNTIGGGLDYMFKNKIGASVGMAKTPFLHQTDYSAMGKLNLFHSPTSSLDLSAGFGRSISPHFSSGWQPQGSLVFSRFFF